jgi:3-oxoadipate enol-lactonase
VPADAVSVLAYLFAEALHDPAGRDGGNSRNDACEARARSAEADGMAAQVIPSLTRWFTLDALAANGRGVRYARERVLRGNPTDWAATWRAFKGLDVQDRLATLEPPTLVLGGEADAATILEPVADIAKRIPGASYQELPGAPHMQTPRRWPTPQFLPAQWCRAHPCQ